MNIDASRDDPSLLISMAFSNVGHVFTHMLTILYATAVLYLPGVFDLSYGEMLGLSSVGLILFGVGSLPAGWFGDRWSQVGMLVIFFIGIGVSTVFTGLSTNTTRLFIGLSLIGLFASIYHPVGIAWLVACARRQGLTLGVNGAFGHLGSAVAPVFVGLMIDYVSWRAAFVLPGAIAILTGALLWVAWARGWVSDRSADVTPVPAPAHGDYRRVFLVLLVTMACNGFVYAGMMNTAPKVFELGLTVTLVDSYTGIGMLTGTVIALSSVCSFIGGWLADRYSPRTIYLIFWMLLVPALILVANASGYRLILAMLLAMSFLVTFAAAENMLVAQYTPFRWRSVAYGARFVLALGIGGLTVYVAGDLFDRTGTFGVLYLLFSAAALVAVLCAFWLPSSGRVIRKQAVSN
ncbi:MAG: MFS transporter [Pseudomonadota bacterium]|nr:MFS transporter [Pseudomonadota bacterium]